MIFNPNHENLILNKGNHIGNYKPWEDRNICTIKQIKHQIKIKEDIRKLEEDENIITESELQAMVTLKIPNEWLQQYIQLISSYQDIFAKTNTIGWSDLISHKVRLNSETKGNIHIKQFPLPRAYEERIRDYIDEMMAKGIIELSK